MTTISEHFALKKTQSELDFVDVPVDGDLPLFVDPFALTLRHDSWSQQCAQDVQDFFQLVVSLIRKGDEAKARQLLKHLREPNETHLGFSAGEPQGAGIGRGQADGLYEALATSAAVKSGFISHLEEAELLIPGVGRDKISDLTTNIIRRRLVDYTQAQCTLHGIPTYRSPLPPYFDSSDGQWKSDYFDLPRVPVGPLLLVPKAIVRYELAYDHQRYYRHFVLEYLRAEELQANSSLVQVLKDGRRKVLVKDLAEKYPRSKDFLFQFSRDHPGVLDEYREQLKKLEELVESPFDDTEARTVAALLAKSLNNIPTGSEHASTYHSFMVGALELILFPQLQHPMKEKEIHDGRKRIDIVFENAARPGLALHDLHAIKKLPCNYVPVECKNYSTEIKNPELDQLAGRFSVKRGQFGIICCRKFEDRAHFVKRCRDTFIDDRGLIIPFDDDTMRGVLELIAKGDRAGVDRVLGELIAEVWV